MVFNPLMQPNFFVRSCRRLSKPVNLDKPSITRFWLDVNALSGETERYCRKAPYPLSFGQAGNAFHDLSRHEKSYSMRLFSYFRSSASYRVRIALNLKGVPHEVVPVDLATDAHLRSPFAKDNPFKGVPAIETDDAVHGQSMAIIEWLDEAFPANPLLPTKPSERLLARELALAIATELHAPLGRPAIQHIRSELGGDQNAVATWQHRWLEKTLSGVEQRLEDRETLNFLFDRPGYFECVLIPQVYNARLSGFDLGPYPRLRKIDEACARLSAFRAAHPDAQPDSRDQI
ncbi:maleylacetoacetate isomerase [Novosphingobium sp.]|uniref:maleylacetoacetate isomerase n=1 Tax=Novosphingobium sp. TaxID=1874826 RepID=UPI0028AC7378|nr:maleylacetoacetate isomerase [Novosphingobium sp.]